MSDKQLIIKAVKEAGKILLQGFGKAHQIQNKTPHDFITEMDRKAENKIKQVLNESGYSYLAEESGETIKKSDYTWVIDPLDGTTNYIMTNPLFNSAIALVSGDEILLSAVYMPFTNRLFYAEKDKGTFVNGKRVHVSNIDSIDKSFIIFCHGKQLEHLKKSVEIYSKFKLICKEVRQLGAASIEQAMVAIGRAEAFILPGAPAWDTAPGALLIKEAGGRVSDFEGREWDVTCKDLLVSNGKVHDEIIRILNE